jgi:chromosome segregation protein
VLKLKRVEIHGFKSFCDRTEMKFNGRGITAVVGPNGCGKSNLSDAINWVLGEQSAKNLRGGRMEDVIFAGTRERKPLGMASVTMTLLAEEGPPAGPPEAGNPPVKADAEKTAERTGEVTISRRLYRSGESEYLVNGKIARLRDIQDLFLGTGLGPESYAIIEQGRIGQILSHKPQDRRAVIEEAAGITKFKMRKRLAEAKLEGAKQNLARVFDILEEVNRQVNSLKRQASKTKRYGELKAEMAAYLRQVLAARYKLLEREIAKTVIELNLASGELESILAHVASGETQQAALIESLYSTEAELTEARKQLADLQLEAERARSRLEYQSKQISQIEARLVSRADECSLLESRQGEIKTELDQQSAEMIRLEEEGASARTALEEKGAERQEAQARLGERERGLESLHEQLLRLLGESSSLKTRVSQSEAQLTSLERERTRADAEERQAQSDLERIQSARQEISEQLVSRQGELTSITGQRQEVEQALHGMREKFEAARQSVDRLRSEFSRVKARKDSLEEVISHRSYTTETVKRLLTATAQKHDHSFAPVGVVADFVEVDPQFEKAAEEFLQEELDYVVVREWAEAERGIDVVRGGEGRATFVVEKFEEPSTGRKETPGPESEEGLVGRLADALRFSNGLSSAPLDLLPRVANCYVAADRGVAQELAIKYPDFWFLADDGISYHGQSVSGGKKTGAGPLALKRELREALQLEETKGRELAAAERERAELEREIGSLGEQLEGLRQGQQSREKDVFALDHESRKLAEEFQRVNTRLSSARLELDRNGRERAKIEESLVMVRASVEQAEQARHQQESALEEARRRLPELQAAVARVTEEHSILRAALAGFEERRRSVSAARQRTEGRARELSSRWESLEREKAELEGEREQLTRSNAELSERNAELADAIGGAQRQVERLSEEEARLRSRMTSGEEELKKWRESAQATQERRSERQVSRVRLESDAKHLEETSQNELQIDAREIAAALEVIPGETELVDLDGKYQDVRRKIEALGPVNTQALEEFEEAQQRQEFLQTQRQDLLDSIRDTEKAIAELDLESRRRFTDAFHIINAHFTELFKILFGGGSGEMRLTDEGNVSESGIDVVASPPGKRLQSVLLLSGGERALTAMALLMAVFQYTPSPFCVLDEVDAPLDEPNIERLTKLLQSMSGETQFIVITHAKRTMEAAQALYGVTMQEPGVSRLVSVNLKPREDELGAQRLRGTREREQELAMA